MCVLKSIFLVCILFGLAFAQNDYPNCGDPEQNTEVWPLADPTYYYACDGYTVKVLQCPEGTGFRKTKDSVGCVPWNMWECFKPVFNENPPGCKTEEVTKLFGYTTPLQYFACKAPHTPMILQCKDGQGFIRTDQHEGCLEWSDWRAQCDRVEGKGSWKRVYENKKFN